MFICIDSDDVYERGSLVSLVNYWEKLNNDNYAGVCYLSRFKNGKIVGTKFPYDEMDSDLISIYYYYNVKGDKGIMFNTRVLKKYRFPVFEDEKFMTEAVLYGKIGLDHKFRLINAVYQIVEYQKNGLSDRYRKLMLENPKGSLLYYSTVFKYRVKGMMKIRALIQLARFTYINKAKWRDSFRECGYDLMFLLLTPIGWILSKKLR